MATWTGHISGRITQLRVQYWVQWTDERFCCERMTTYDYQQAVKKTPRSKVLGEGAKIEDT